MIRKLAKAVSVDAIHPIEGADSLELAIVGGWRCVVRKGEFSAGDVAVYLEIDSFLPEGDSRWTSFCARGTTTAEVDGTLVKGHRVKTIKLRGQLSQGLLLSFASLGLDPLPHGEDLTERLGVLKYEPPFVDTAKLGRGEQQGSFPAEVPKTDAERVQNVPEEWLASQRPEDWYATEKIDGTSLTVVKFFDGTVTVCSRNYAIKSGDNVYWEAAEKILPHLATGFAAQAEIYGPGIQGNPLRLATKQVSVFLVYEIGAGYVPRERWSDGLRQLGVPVLELDYAPTKAALLAQADNLKSRIAPDRLAEGIVWQHREGNTSRVTDNRPVFKAINNQYLLKESR